MAIWHCCLFSNCECIVEFYYVDRFEADSYIKVCVCSSDEMLPFQ